MNIFTDESYKSWLNLVTAAPLAQYHMSLYEPEDDLPDECLWAAFHGGLSPESFVDAEVILIFWSEKRT